MADSIPLLIQRDEVQMLQNRLNKGWRSDHVQALRAWDWEYIVGKCLRFPQDLEIGWKLLCREAVTNEIKDLRERAESLRIVFDATIDVAQTAYQKAFDFATATGHAIEGLEDLKTLPAVLERMREKYLFRLSLIDDQIIQEASTEGIGEDYATPGEALADLLAARHAARITPSYAELRQWADRCPPAPAWLDEGDDPS